MTNVLNDFVKILVGGIEGIATGVAAGVKGYVTDLFLEVVPGADGGEPTYKLSVFGATVAIFAGVGLAIKSDGEYKSRKKTGMLKCKSELKVA